MTFSYVQYQLINVTFDKALYCYVLLSLAVVLSWKDLRKKLEYNQLLAILTLFFHGDLPH